MSTSPKPWDGVISPQEQRRYDRSGFFKVPRIGPAALLVVDMQYRMLGTKPMPVDEAIKEFPSACGEVGWAAVPSIAAAVAHFRERGMPVIHLTLGARRAFNQGARAKASGGSPRQGLDLSSAAAGDEPGFRIIDELAPRADEVVIRKYGPSAFFGTPLSSLLTADGISTVCVVGSTTSGCVRASVVDAFSHGFSVVVPFDCVFDRSEVSHAVSLFDMATRYAQVTDLEGARELFATANTRSGQ